VERTRQVLEVPAVIVLDTNVLSALMNPAPDAAVLSWLDGMPSEELCTTSVTVFEILAGIEELPESKRRNFLRMAFDLAMREFVQGRVFAFDAAAAHQASIVAARRKMSGRPAGYHDTVIAGILLSLPASIATRNVKHFSDIGVPVLNPWSDDR
jgi:toxin FitB